MRDTNKKINNYDIMARALEKLNAVGAERIKPNPVLRNKVGFLEIIVF